MRITRPDLAALAVCVVALVGIIMLTALHDPVPSIVNDVALIALSAGVGIATQSVTSTPASPELTEPVAAAPAAVVIPAQAAVSLEAPVATHAPA